jgi:hypothetical protein
MTVSPGTTASVLRDLIQEYRGRDVSVQAIADKLKDRSFGILMILFALPNAVIPGISFVLGAPVLIAGLQLAVGRTSIWLPSIMLRQVIPADLFQNIAGRVERFMSWVERRTSKRWTWMTSGVSERLLGLYIAIVAAFLMLPIPFGNLLPAFGISLMAVGLNEEDGLAALIGAVLGTLGIAYIVAVFVVGLTAIKALIGFM